MTERRQRRRTVLRTLAGTGVVGLAGCLGGDESGSDETSEDETETSEDVPTERQLNGVIMRSFFPIRLYEPGKNTKISEIHYHEDFSHWHFTPLQIPLDSWRTVETKLYNADDEEVALGADKQFQLGVSRTEGTPEDLLQAEITDALVSLQGVSEGDGELVFHIRDGDENLWTTPRLPVAVGTQDT
jgi:hypothetical protein